MRSHFLNEKMGMDPIQPTPTGSFDVPTKDEPATSQAPANDRSVPANGTASPADLFMNAAAEATQRPAGLRRRTTARDFAMPPLSPAGAEVFKRLQNADRPFVDGNGELISKRMKTWHDLHDLLELIDAGNAVEKVREVLTRVRIPRPKDWANPPSSPIHFLYRWIYDQREEGRALLYADTTISGAADALKQFMGRVWDADDNLREQAKSVATAIAHAACLTSFYALEPDDFRSRFESAVLRDKKSFYLHPLILESEIYQPLRHLMGLGLGIDFHRITPQDIERVLRIHILENRSLLPLRALVEGPFVRLAREWMGENKEFNQLVFTAVIDDFLQSRANVTDITAAPVLVLPEDRSRLLKECDLKPETVDWVIIEKAATAFVAHYADKIKGEDAEGNFGTDRKAARDELRRARKEFNLLSRQFFYRIGLPDQPLQDQRLADSEIPFAIYADRRGRIHYYLAMQMTHRIHVPPASKIARILEDHPDVILTFRKTNSDQPAERITRLMDCLTFATDAGDWVVWTATGREAREVLRMLWYLNENHWPNNFVEGEEPPTQSVEYTSVELLGREVLSLMEELQTTTLSGVYSAADNAFVIGPSGASHYQIAIAAGFDEAFLHGRMARVAFSRENGTLKVMFPIVTAFDERRGRQVIESKLKALFEGIQVARLQAEPVSSLPSSLSVSVPASPQGARPHPFFGHGTSIFHPASVRSPVASLAVK